MGSCEHDNEFSGSMKYLEIFSGSATIGFHKGTWRI
jgi:hypothetical protein